MKQLVLSQFIHLNKHYFSQLVLKIQSVRLCALFYGLLSTVFSSVMSNKASV